MNLKRRGDRHKIVRGRMAGRQQSNPVRSKSVPVKRVPPVPYLGVIERHMLPAVITDYESKSDTSWSTGNFYDSWVSGTTFSGNQRSCIYYVLSVADQAVTDTSVVMDPLRFSVAEPAATDDDFDRWCLDASYKPSNNDNGNPTTEQLSAVRGKHLFALNTLLPVSGNSHVSDGTPPEFLLTLNQLFGSVGGVSTCFAHIAYSHGGWNPATNVNPASVLPVNLEVTPRWARFRLNGTAVGSLIDLEDQIDFIRTRPGTRPNQLAGAQPLNVFFPSTPRTDGFAVASKQGWALDFTAGDTLEIDVWLQIAARPLSAPFGPTPGAKAVVVFFETGDTTYGSDCSIPQTISGFNFPRGGSKFVASLIGMEVSNGFDPSSMTYTLTPADGEFTLGKASSSGAVYFDITSQRMIWYVQESLAGGTEPGTGTSSWQSDNGGPWELISNDCTGGSFPVSPAEDPPPPEDPPTFTISFGSCAITAPGRVVTMYVELNYSSEIAWLTILFEFAAVPASSLPKREFTRTYRPQSSGDYITQVTDRVEGTILCGPCGVFDHLGSTTFEMWQGTQASPYTVDYSDEFTAVSSDGYDYEAAIPTSFTISKVAL